MNVSNRQDLEKEIQKCQVRSQLHTRSNMSWLNKRQNKEKPQAQELYRYFPEERMKHIELTLLFQKFDKDNSDALDFVEVYRMFKKYGIFLSREELLDFFKVVDINKDFSLNLSEFKSCYLDKNAKEIFAKIMKQLAHRTNLTQEQIVAALEEMNDIEPQMGNAKNPSPVLPTSFSAVMSLLTYLSHRDEIKEKLSEKSVNMKEQFGNLKQLVELSNKIDVEQQKIQFERKLKIPKTEEDRMRKFRKQLINLKKQAKIQGQHSAEEELRKKNSAQLITVIPERVYKYQYGRQKFVSQQLKYKPIYQTERTDYNDLKAKTFFKFMNVNVPEELKIIDNRIWNKLFESEQKLDVILERNKKNEVESIKTDRLRVRIKQTLNQLETNLEQRFESKMLEKQKVEIPQYEEHLQNNLPTLPTTRYSPDQKWYTQSTTNQQFFSRSIYSK